jgi:hypothetical protein
MPAGKHDIYIEQGATWSLPLVWKTAEGVAIDVTGYTARMHMRKKVTDAEIVMELTTENNRITLGGAAGTINLAITAADTETLTGSGVYDLEMIAPDLITVTRLLEGKYALSVEVTRPGARRG